MITDNETNFIYLSNLLEEKCPNVFNKLKRKFEHHGIKYDILPNTKDIWVVDFMPLQVRKDYFVQYKYDPDYLKTKKGETQKSDPRIICEEIGIVPNRVSIVLDGGNVVKHKNKAIVTTKIFKENLGYPESNLITEIKNQLDVEQVIIIPQEPKDSVGHADAMVRFIDENRVFINNYPKNKVYQDFGYNLIACLRNAGLRFEFLPYTSWENKKESDATGCYINYLEVGDFIFFPRFGMMSDFTAQIQLEKYFKNRMVIDVDCSELAILGGVLNCATWNILK